MIKLAPDLTLPSKAITETFAILAARGAGKSNTGAVMAEEFFKAKLPFVVVDPVRAWWGLRSSRDGKGPGLPIPIFGGKRGDVPLERQGGSLVADLVAEQRLSCVLDISLMESEGAKKQFLLDFARRLYEKNEHPLHLFLEEADDYIPQKPMRDEAQLLRAWENIVRRGRSRGLGMTMITQRSAVLNKNVLTQAQTLIAMRTTGPQDIAAIEAWLKYHGQSHEILASLPSLKDGEGWIWSPRFLETTKRVRFRLRETYDSGATPSSSATTARAPATLADVNLGDIQKRMAATIEKAKAEDPRELRRQLAEVKAELAKERGNKNAITMAKVSPAPKRVPVLKDTQVKRLETLFLKFIAEADRHGKAMSLLWGNQNELATALLGALKQVSDGARRLQATSPAHSVSPRVEAIRQQQRSGTGKVTAVMVSRRGVESSDGLTPAKQRLLNVLAFLETIGISQADKAQLALMADTRPTSGSYFNNLSALRTAGLIDYPRSGTVALTDGGRAVARAEASPQTTGELHELIRGKLPPAKWRLIEILIAVYPRAISKDDLAQKAGASITSGSYFNNLSSLRTLGLIDYPSTGQVIAQPVLFLDR